MRVKIGSIAFLVAAIIAIAGPATACEDCVPAGYNGWLKCESGLDSGYDWCYGGFGEPCSRGGSCGGGGDINEPLKDYSVIDVGQDEPSHGFQLRTELEPLRDLDLKPSAE